MPLVRNAQPLVHSPQCLTTGKNFAAFSVYPHDDARNPVTHRTFKDRQGRIWDVWQVHPSAAERRFVQRRTREEDRTDSSERRSGKERRTGAAKKARATIAEEFTYGWLCFECVDEKRRLAPVPEGWDRADDETIEQWCCVAKPVVRRKTDPQRPADGPKLP